MFPKILIANRGEIACRVMRTAQRLGVRTVAVYSDADARAKHVAMADEAYRLGPPSATESYLCGDKIIEIARRSGTEAIHPGYGFLSENADFAEACVKADLVFIGPSAKAIWDMGDKARAKAVMSKAGVPVTPGYHGGDQDAERLAAEAKKIGYPLLIKASAGGGGKGMRRVDKAKDFASALESCRREARNAFGNDHVLLEKYIAHPRHIEIQVFADNHGNVVHLFERDCSVQRRHQKVLEEAPAPGVTETLRAQMGTAAIAAAKAIGYCGAGTVEFIVETDGRGAPSHFYFMEMNTRLQVEHPVTETITGLDLVEWQLRVARGEVLPLTQEQITRTGHAIEARLYAEDPANDFLPATGTLNHLSFPKGEGIRIDVGVRQGDAVSIHYDPMIAKIITGGRSRAEAGRRLQQALRKTEVGGVVTNRDFLLDVTEHKAFADGRLETGFIEAHRAELQPKNRAAPDRVLVMAALALLREHGERAHKAAFHHGDPYSPWSRTDGWRLNGASHDDFLFADGEGERQVRLQGLPDGCRCLIEEREIVLESVQWDGVRLRAVYKEENITVSVVTSNETVTVIEGSNTYRLGIINPMQAAETMEETDDKLTAPMPGKIAAVHVEVGDSVTAGQSLMILEAMKMEHNIMAPWDGVVRQVHYAVGEQVEEGVELILLAEKKVHEA